MLTLIDEYSRTCLVVHCARHIGANEVIEQWANVMIVHGIPQHIRSDNGPHSSLGYKPPAPEAIINMPIQNLHSVMH